MSPKTDAAHRQIEQTVHIEQTGQIVRCKPVKKPSRRSEWDKRAGPQDIFRRNMIESKYCRMCGGEFLERREQTYCPKCRAMRKKQAQKKYAVLHARGRY